jgi:hypothetical protein
MSRWLIVTIMLAGAAFGFDDSSKARPGFDGPAKLPRVHVESAMADTPAHGAVHAVRDGEDIQKALDNAKCGDTVTLQAGVFFHGVLRFPSKPCDDAHWIIVRTSAPDSDLPSEGTRITPCYAGVASLPGRPDFHCATPHNVMAKIEFDAVGDSGPIRFLSGANHYRLIGLEITRARPQFHMRHLIAPDQPDSTADHLIFDRLWVHGTAEDETKDGLHLSGVTYAAVVDSYFTDFHCIARSGSCTDAQAVNGGTGDLPGGPYKIANNFLEASGENILFGGAAGTSTPADIEILHNHFFKPLIWKTGQTGFVGSYSGDPFIVKNIFELKNAQRVLLEGNLLENSWGGFSQTGFAILLTPANQGGKCPLCQVSDVTIRYNQVRHVASVLQLATGVANAERAGTSGGQRYSIHDLVVDDIDPEKYRGFGVFSVIVSVQPAIRAVRIDHVTAFPPKALISILNHGSKLENFTIVNSLFTAGPRQLVTAGGGTENCTLPRDQPLEVLDHCFANATFTHNLIIGGKKKWPEGNLLVGDGTAAGIVDFHGGNGGDYRLCPEVKGECKARSIGIKAGIDGKDIGADIEAVDKAVSGAE